MARFSDLYPSNYIKAADLQGRNVTVTISRVEIEEIGQDRKPVAYFEGKEKGLVLNKTNGSTIAQAYGDETDDWVGAELILYPTSVLYEGKSVEAVRVRIPPRKPVQQGAPTPRPAADAIGYPRREERETGRATDLDDDIPF